MSLANQGVLAGLKVLDFTAAMAGPQCTLLLGDFGADVIKVEPPSGDTTRRWGRNRFGEDDQFTGLFIAMNRNKRGISLDLKSAEGLFVAQTLMRDADVIVENFTPGVADRLGIGYKAAVKLNPEVIYCSVSGFGQTGPLSQRQGLDMLMQAYTGHMSVTGEEGRPSIRNGPAPTDVLTGTNAAVGILLALLHKHNTGKGQYLEVSLYDSALEIMTHFIADYTGSKEIPRKTGPYFAFCSPYGMYAGNDREFYIGVSDDAKFAKLCIELGLTELIDDERFRSNARRIENRNALNEILIPVFRGQPAQHWLDVGVRLGIPVSLVETVPEVVQQPQARSREMLVVSGIGDVEYVGMPIKLHGTPGSIRRQPPDIGQDNNILTGLSGWPADASASL